MKLSFCVGADFVLVRDDNKKGKSKKARAKGNSNGAVLAERGLR
jgi:hypothetical protein